MSSPDDESRLIVLGRVTKPHGIKGEVRVVSYAESEQSFIRRRTILLRSEEGEVRRLGLLGLRVRPQDLIFRLEGVTDRDAAQALAGSEIVVRRGDLPEPEEGEYYRADLIGLAVRNSLGQDLGRVENIFETGANDVLVVRGPDGAETLVPALDGVIVEVNLQGGLMTVDLPEMI